MLILDSANNQPWLNQLEHHTFDMAQVRQGFESRQGGSLSVEGKIGWPQWYALGDDVAW